MFNLRFSGHSRYFMRISRSQILQTVSTAPVRHLMSDRKWRELPVWFCKLFLSFCVFLGSEAMRMLRRPGKGWRGCWMCLPLSSSQMTRVMPPGETTTGPATPRQSALLSVGLLKNLLTKVFLLHTPLPRNRLQILNLYVFFQKIVKPGSKVRFIFQSSAKETFLSFMVYIK